MAESILGGIAQEITLGQVASAVADLLRADQLQRTPSGALQVGNAASKFRDQCNTLDLVSTWKYMPESTSGVTLDVRGDSGGASYFNFNSGVEAGSTLGLISRESFSLPIRLSVGLTASQRIAGTDFYVELVEVDEAGDVVTDTALFAAPAVLNARNAVGMKFSGSNTLNGYYAMRSQGGSELVSGPVSYGASHLSASGSSPNFSPTNQFDILLKHDLFWISSRAVNSTSGATATVMRTDIVPDPDARYALRLRLINTTAPASATDYRVHFVRVLDASAMSVDFSAIGGGTPDMLAAPVKVIGTAAIGAANPTGPALYADTATPLAASATMVGSGRDAGSTSTYRRFSASFFADVPGTAFIDLSNDNTTFRVCSRADIAAGVGQVLDVPITARYYRVRYVNGGTAQTAFLVTSAFHRV